MDGILGDAVDDDWISALADLVAAGGFDLRLSSAPKTERDTVQYTARDLTIFGDACDSRKSHSRRSAH